MLPPVVTAMRPICGEMSLANAGGSGFNNVLNKKTQYFKVFI
jgi:hypothetical protein